MSDAETRERTGEGTAPGHDKCSAVRPAAKRLTNPGEVEALLLIQIATVDALINQHFSQGYRGLTRDDLEWLIEQQARLIDGLAKVIGFRALAGHPK